MTPAETIKRLEAVRNWHISEERYYAEKNTGITATHTMFIADIESALAHLRTTEGTVRKCVEICDNIIAGRTAVASRGDEGAAYEADWTRNIKTAILAHYGLEKK